MKNLKTYVTSAVTFIQSAVLNPTYKYVSNNKTTVYPVLILIVAISLYTGFYRGVFIIFLLIVKSESENIFKKFPQIETLKIQVLKDQETVQYHLKKDFGHINFVLTIILYLFPVLYVCSLIFLTQQSPTIIGLESSQCKKAINFMLFLSSVWMVSIIIQWAIIQYIILYANTSVVTKTAQGLISFIPKTFLFGSGGAFFGGVLMYIPSIEPNPYTNFAHCYTPIGRGFACKSMTDFRQLDALKSAMSIDFDPAPFLTDVNGQKTFDNEKVYAWAQVPENRKMAERRCTTDQLQVLKLIGIWGAR